MPCPAGEPGRTEMIEKHERPTCRAKRCGSTRDTLKRRGRAGGFDKDGIHRLHRLSAAPLPQSPPTFAPAFAGVHKNTPGIASAGVLERPLCSGWSDLVGLQAFLTRHDLEAHFLAFLQGTETRAGDGAKITNTSGPFSRLMNPNPCCR